MKYLIPFIFLIVFTGAQAQKKKKFKAGAYLIENKLNKDIKNAETILFVFQGEFDAYPPKTSIETFLEKLFKKSKFKVTFVYWDSRKNEFSVPNTQTSDYDLACLLAYDYGTRLNEHEDQRRQLLSHWNIVCERGDTAENLGYAKIDVYSKHFLFTENHATSKMIFNLFAQ